MKFATIPITSSTDGISTDAPFVMCFPMRGTYELNHQTQDLTPYPIELTLDEAAEYYWRIKEFTATITHSFFGTKSIIIRRITDPALNDERELLKPWPEERYGADWIGDHDESIFGERTRYIEVNVRMFFVAEAADPAPATTAYYISHSDDVARLVPSIELRVTGFWDSGTEFSIDGTSAYEVESPSDLITATLHNSELEFAMTSISGFALESLFVTPTKFYTWANDDGTEPTWDEFTGEKV